MKPFRTVCVALSCSLAAIVSPIFRSDSTNIFQGSEILSGAIIEELSVIGGVVGEGYEETEVLVEESHENVEQEAEKQEAENQEVENQEAENQEAENQDIENQLVTEESDKDTGFQEVEQQEKTNEITFVSQEDTVQVADTNWGSFTLEANNGSTLTEGSSMTDPDYYLDGTVLYLNTPTPVTIKENYRDNFTVRNEMQTSDNWDVTFDTVAMSSTSSTPVLFSNGGGQNSTLTLRGGLKIDGSSSRGISSENHIVITGSSTLYDIKSSDAAVYTGGSLIISNGATLRAETVGNNEEMIAATSGTTINNGTLYAISPNGIKEGTKFTAQGNSLVCISGDAGIVSRNVTVEGNAAVYSSGAFQYNSENELVLWSGGKLTYHSASSSYEDMDVTGGSVIITPSGLQAGSSGATVNIIGSNENLTLAAGDVVPFGDYDENQESAPDPEPDPDPELLVFRVDDIASCVYDGLLQKPELVVYGSEDALLTEDVDYTLTYTGNKNVGTATVTITGKGDYEKATSSEVTFEITARPLVITPKSDLGHTYGEEMVVLTCTYEGLISGEEVGTTETLVCDIGAGEVGTYEITQGIFELTETDTFSPENYIITFQNGVKYTIVGKLIETATCSTLGSVVYNGNTRTPTVSLSMGSIELVMGTDYTLSYSDNKEVGTATVTATGRGNYTGEKTTSFAITPREITLIPTAGFSHTYGDSNPLENISYSYSNEIPEESPSFAGSFALTWDSSQGGTAQEVGQFFITQGTFSFKNEIIGTFDPKNYSLVVDETTLYTVFAKDVADLDYDALEDMTYTGVAQIPNLNIKHNGETLVLESDYTQGVENNIQVGTAIATVTGTGNYTGEYQLEFQILPQELQIIPASGLSHLYGESDKTITHSYQGLVNGEIPLAAGQLSRETGSDVGLYDITMGTLTLTDNDPFFTDNYRVSLAEEVYTITGQGIIFDYYTPLAEVTYHGEEQKPALSLYNNSQLLEETTDYSLSYSDNKDVGTATITVTGEGNYSGTQTVMFEIRPRHLTVTPTSGSHVLGEGEFLSSCTYENALISEPPSSMGQFELEWDASQGPEEDVGVFVIKQGTFALKALGNFNPDNYTFTVVETESYEIIEPATTPDPEPEVTPESESEPEVTPESESEPEVTPESDPEPEVTPESESEPEVTPESESEPEVTPESESEPEVTPESESEPEVTPESESEPEVTPESESEPEVTPESESEVAPNGDSPPSPEGGEDTNVETDTQTPSNNNNPSLDSSNSSSLGQLLGDTSPEDVFGVWELEDSDGFDVSIENDEEGIDGTENLDENLGENLDENGTPLDEGDRLVEEELELFHQEDEEPEFWTEERVVAAGVATVTVVGLGIAIATGNLGILATAVSGGVGSALSTGVTTLDKVRQLIQALLKNQDLDGSFSGSLKIYRKKPFSEKVLLRSARMLRYGVSQIPVTSYEMATEVLLVAKEEKAPVVISMEHLLVVEEGDLDAVLDNFSTIMKKNKIRVPVGIHIQQEGFQSCMHALAMGVSSVEYMLPDLGNPDVWKEMKKLKKRAKKKKAILEVRHSLLDEEGTVCALSAEECKHLKKAGFSTILLDVKAPSSGYPAHWMEALEEAICEIREGSKSLRIGVCGEIYLNEEQVQSLIKSGVTKVELHHEDEALTSTSMLEEKFSLLHATGKGSNTLKIANFAYRVWRNIMFFV